MNRLTRSIRPLLIAWLLLAWTAVVAAQSPAVVHLEPADLVLPAGETARLTISIEGATDLFGVELHLVYDPAVIQVLDDDAGREGVQITPGSMLDPAAGFMVVNAADNEVGELTYAMTLLAPAEAVAGDGVLAAFDIQALSNGTSPLTLLAVLASADGAALPVTVESGRVTVGSGQAKPTPASAAQSPTAEPAVTLSSGETSSAAATPTLPPEATAPAPGGGIRTATPTELPPAANSDGEGAGNEEQAMESEPTTSLQAALPVLGQPDGNDSNQPAAQDQATPIAAGDDDDAPTNQEGGQVAGSSPQSIHGPEGADSKAQSGSDDDSLMAGGVVLVGLLVIAIVIFFGRRLLGRKQ